MGCLYIQSISPSIECLSALLNKVFCFAFVFFSVTPELKKKLVQKLYSESERSSIALKIILASASTLFGMISCNTPMPRSVL